MHATERDAIILRLIDESGFVSFQDLAAQLSASPATLRRDLDRLENSQRLVRVRGGARAIGTSDGSSMRLQGIPFHENVNRNRAEKEAIGRAAAALCRQGEAVIIDGGSTTLKMCPHLEPYNLQVLTNSLHIVGALLQQKNTRVTIPGGVVFREQNIVLDPFEDVVTRGFHASRIFISSAAVSRFGLMQSDIILVQAERKLLQQADAVVALIDSSKFQASAGHQLCELSKIHTLITDTGIDDDSAKMIEDSGINLIRVPV